MLKDLFIYQNLSKTALSLKPFYHDKEVLSSSSIKKQNNNPLPKETLQTLFVCFESGFAEGCLTYHSFWAACTVNRLSGCDNCNSCCSCWPQRLVAEFLPSSIINCTAIMRRVQLLHKTVLFINFCVVIVNLCWKKARAKCFIIHQNLEPITYRHILETVGKFDIQLIQYASSNVMHNGQLW